MDAIVKVKLGKEEFEINVEEVAGIGENIDEEMDRVSAQIAFYGTLLATARCETVILDSLYRKWRAGVAHKSLVEDSKLSEWKTKSAIESDDKFMTYKQAEAHCRYNETVLENFVVALKEKSQNLRSKGARMREEMAAINMGTPARR
jgi:hypothetical protein